MRAADRQPSLSGMTRLLANGVEHQRTTGDRFGMLIGVGETDEQTPPVVDQGWGFLLLIPALAESVYGICFVTSRP